MHSVASLLLLLLPLLLVGHPCVGNGAQVVCEPTVSAAAAAAVAAAAGTWQEDGSIAVHSLQCFLVLLLLLLLLLLLMV